MTTRGGLPYWDPMPQCPPKMTAQEWEATAVDFLPVEIKKFSKKDLLRFAEDARTFILVTMGQMELRPRRSYLRRLARKK